MAPQITLTVCYTHHQLDSFVTTIYEVLSQKPLILFLSGPLGAGKTTFSQAWLRCCGVQGAIPSPTYTIVESYQTQYGTWHHFDCYRLDSAQMLVDIGIEDYLDGNIICEWPNQGMSAIVTPTLILEFDFTEVQDSRLIHLTVDERVGDTLSQALQKYIV